MALSMYVCVDLCMPKSISMYVYVCLYIYSIRIVYVYLASRSMRYPGVLGSGLRGGPMTNLAAWAQSLCQQWVPSVPSPAAMGSPNTTRPVEGGGSVAQCCLFMAPPLLGS